jgi:hypothetical protein
MFCERERIVRPARMILCVPSARDNMDGLLGGAPARGRICMQIALFCYQLIKPQTKWQQSRLLYPNLFVLERRRRATKSRTPRENLRFLPRESGAKIKSFECRDSPLAWAKRLGSLGVCVCETVFCKRASGLRAQMQNASALYMAPPPSECRSSAVSTLLGTICDI